MHNENTASPQETESLTSNDDFVVEARKTATDAVRTAAVWTLAGLMTQGAREVISRVVKSIQNQVNHK